MANDGCQLPAWTGQAFAYLPHHPRGTALASQSYAQLKPQGDLYVNYNLDRYLRGWFSLFTSGGVAGCVLCLQGCRRMLV
jgi:hypothetical protein